MALDTFNICKAGDMDRPVSWTYYDIACLIEDMATLSAAEKSGLRMFVRSYAREIASRDGRKAARGMFDAVEEMADYMHDYARRMKEIIKDADSCK